MKNSALGLISTLRVRLGESVASLQDVTKRKVFEFLSFEFWKKYGKLHIYQDFLEIWHAVVRTK